MPGQVPPASVDCMDRKSSLATRVPVMRWWYSRAGKAVKERHGARATEFIDLWTGSAIRENVGSPMSAPLLLFGL